MRFFEFCISRQTGSKLLFLQNLRQDRIKKKLCQVTFFFHLPSPPEIPGLQTDLECPNLYKIRLQSKTRDIQSTFQLIKNSIRLHSWLLVCLMSDVLDILC